jgi:hypothetical protein
MVEWRYTPHIFKLQSRWRRVFCFLGKYIRPTKKHTQFNKIEVETKEDIIDFRLPPRC